MPSRSKSSRRSGAGSRRRGAGSRSRSGSRRSGAGSRRRRSRRSGAGETGSWWEHAHTQWQKVPSRAGVGKHAWDQWQKVPEVKAPEGYTLTQSNIEYVRKLRRDFVQHMLNSNPLIVAGLSLGAMSALVAILGIRKYWPEIKPSFMRAKANLPKNGGRKSVSKKSKKPKSHRK